MNTHAARMSAISANFQTNSQPACLRMPSLASTSGTPPSSVPAGQIHLQKAGTETPSRQRKYSGSANTNTARIPYFNMDSRRLHLPLRSFGDGILYSRSCKSPNGHRKAQTARPSNAPKISSVPSTYSGSAG